MNKTIDNESARRNADAGLENPALIEEQAMIELALAQQRNQVFNEQEEKEEVEQARMESNPNDYSQE